MSIPVTSVTFYTEDMGNTFAAKGFVALSKRYALVVEETQVVLHEADQPDFFSRLPLTPTFWPANAVLRLIFRVPKHTRPHMVTATVRSWNGILELGEAVIGTR